jgi:hypothetical protein
MHKDKVTPTHDVTWYIKWASSLIIVIAVMCRSVEEVPKIYDVSLSLVGCIGWGVVGYLWHDRALLMLNSILCIVLATSILRHVVS